jgi:hypothetical protein
MILRWSLLVLVMTHLALDVSNRLLANLSTQTPNKFTALTPSIVFTTSSNRKLSGILAFIALALALEGSSGSTRPSRTRSV